MNATLTLSAILQDVIANPDDDFPRLAFADLLDDLGIAPERAWYIRRSIRVPQCSHIDLTASDPFPLLGLLSGKAQSIGPPHDPVMRTWMWGETDQLGLVVSDLGRGLDYRVERGFVSAVMCKEDAWLVHGPRIAGTHPVERVIFTDKMPISFPPSEWRGWMCGNDIRREGASVLDSRLYACLSRGGDRPRWYEKGEDPLADLSNASILWARETFAVERSECLQL